MNKTTKRKTPEIIDAEKIKGSVRCRDYRKKSSTDSLVNRNNLYSSWRKFNSSLVNNVRTLNTWLKIQSEIKMQPVKVSSWGMNRVLCSPTSSLGGSCSPSSDRICVPLRWRSRPRVWAPRLPLGVRMPVRAKHAGRPLSAPHLAQPPSHPPRLTAARRQLLRPAEPRQRWVFWWAEHRLGSVTV